MDTTTFDRFDTETDTLPNGEPRCERRINYWDKQIDDLAGARCTSPATLRVRFAYPEGSLEEVNACRQCYENFLLLMGQIGYEVKIEALAELPHPGPGFVFLTDKQIAKVKL